MVDWSALTVDQLGKSMTPDEVDQLLIVRFEALEQQDVLEKAATDCLQQKDITGVVEVYPEPGLTQSNLSDFQLIGYQVDPAEQFQEGMGTFLLSAYTKGVPGVRMLSFLQPSAGSENLELLLTNDSATVDYSVDLSVGERIPAPQPRLIGPSSRFQPIVEAFPSTNTIGSWWPSTSHWASRIWKRTSSASMRWLCRSGMRTLKVVVPLISPRSLAKRGRPFQDLGRTAFGSWPSGAQRAATPRRPFWLSLGISFPVRAFLR
jgi:hypothetical protein